MFLWDRHSCLSSFLARRALCPPARVSVQNNSPTPFMLPTHSHYSQFISTQSLRNANGSIFSPPVEVLVPNVEKRRLHVPEANCLEVSPRSARWIHRADRVPIQPRRPARNFESYATAIMGD